MDCTGKVCGKQQIAVDIANAGEGDYVIVVEDGGASRMLMENETAVVDWVIAGVIDEACLDL